VQPEYVFSIKRVDLTDLFGPLMVLFPEWMRERFPTENDQTAVQLAEGKRLEDWNTFMGAVLARCRDS
jgi:hypothetical protein